MGDWKGKGDVMIGLGGGHYAPRHKAVVENGNIWLGHILAGYSLDFDAPNRIIGGKSPIIWQDSIISAIESTKQAFPGGDIFVHLDRKSFKGWQRDLIKNFLTEKDILIRRGKDISQE
jgi:D-aminoacyl-tRNA deacylase